MTRRCRHACAQHSATTCRLIEISRASALRSLCVALAWSKHLQLRTLRSTCLPSRRTDDPRARTTNARSVVSPEFCLEQLALWPRALSVVASLIDYRRGSRSRMSNENSVSGRLAWRAGAGVAHQIVSPPGREPLGPSGSGGAWICLSLKCSFVEGQATDRRTNTRLVPGQSFHRNARPRCPMHRRCDGCPSAQSESTSRGRMKRHHADRSSPASVGFGPLLFSNTDGPSSEPWRLQSERQACVFDVFRTRSKLSQPWQIDVPAAATCQCLNLADGARSWWFSRSPSLLPALPA